MKPSKFVILANPSKDPEGKEIRRISEYLRSRGAQAWVLAEENGQIPRGIGDCPVLQEERKIGEMDMALILGGDGTMLSSARRLHYYHVPMLGINLGHLGFLTGCEKEDSQQVLKQVLAGDFQEEERVMLRGRIVHAGDQTEQHFTGLNDAAITRAAFSRMLTIGVEVEGRFMDHIQADGMIVATPTGSTGYNLSAGGPIVVPYARAILITPICPRSLSMRSIVISEKEEVCFYVLPEEGVEKMPELMLTLDGQQGYSIAPGDRVYISVDPVGIRLVRAAENTFFDTLRKKLFKE